MRVSFSSFEQYSIAEAEISEMDVLGVGGSVTPQFWVPMRLSVSHRGMKSRDGLEVVSLTGRLSTVNGPLATALPVNIAFIIPQGYDGYKDQHCYLEFSLDAIRIDALEKLRAGGDLSLRLDAILQVNKLHSLNQRPPNQPLAEIVWGYVQPHKLFLQTDLKIPRDVWISRVLRNVGYGIVQVIELPAAPLEACASLDHSFKALQQAQEMHKIGLYDEAVGKCRVALDKFFEYEEKTGEDGKTKKVPVLIKSWETKIGKATYDWLNAMFGALKGAANRSHHSPNQHFNLLDSQMIIMVTAAMVAYVARTLKADA